MSMLGMITYFWSSLRKRIVFDPVFSNVKRLSTFWICFSNIKFNTKHTFVAKELTDFSNDFESSKTFCDKKLSEHTFRNNMFLKNGMVGLGCMWDMRANILKMTFQSASKYCENLSQFEVARNVHSKFISVHRYLQEKTLHQRHIMHEMSPSLSILSFSGNLS